MLGMTNKEIHMGFLWMVAHGEVRTAYNKYIAPNFIHHNQHFKGDRESLMVTHGEVVRAGPQAQNIAVIHISKIVDGKIVELWDVGQILSPDSPNQNGPF